MAHSYFIAGWRPHSFTTRQRTATSPLGGTPPLHHLAARHRFTTRRHAAPSPPGGARYFTGRWYATR
ncbi:hypothetical protein ACIHAA_12895 [Streptomyces sp. NPDC052040]|uniref:hypothetical protein n=1 Tax=unclassified Streptomyces TaxID=2593676 RepID=UPI0037D80913